MNKRQIELLNFLGYKVDGNKIYGEKESISSIVFDEKSKLFTIKMKSYSFKPGDYESMEMFTFTINHQLGLVYELNDIKEKYKND